MAGYPAAVCGKAVLKQATGQMFPGNMLVTIQTRDGLNIHKGNLDYCGLKELVEKLEGYVDNFGFDESLLSSRFSRYALQGSRVSEIIRSRYHRDPL